MAFDEPQRYRDYQIEPGVIPPYCDGPNGRRWFGALGLLKDGLAAGATEAMRAHFLSYAPEDALALHGEQRGFPRAPGESVEEYRARLKLTWHLSQWRGTAKGIIDALAGLGMTNVAVKEAFTSGWGRSGGAVAKQRWVWVVIRQPHPFGTDYSFAYGDGTTYGSGKLYGANGDPRLIALVKRLVRSMKPAHAHCPEIIVVLDGDIVDGTGTTSDGNKTSGSKVIYLAP